MFQNTPPSLEGLVKIRNNFVQSDLYHLLILHADMPFIDEICPSLPHESPPHEAKIDVKDILSEELNSSIIKFCVMEVTPYRKK